MKTKATAKMFNLKWLQQSLLKECLHSRYSENSVFAGSHPSDERGF